MSDAGGGGISNAADALNFSHRASEKEPRHWEGSLLFFFAFAITAFAAECCCLRALALRKPPRWRTQRFSLFFFAASSYRRVRYQNAPNFLIVAIRLDFDYSLADKPYQIDLPISHLLASIWNWRRAVILEFDFSSLNFHRYVTIYRYPLTRQRCQMERLKCDTHRTLKYDYPLNRFFFLRQKIKKLRIIIEKLAEVESRIGGIGNFQV